MCLSASAVCEILGSIPRILHPPPKKSDIKNMIYSKGNVLKPVIL